MHPISKGARNTSNFLFDVCLISAKIIEPHTYSVTVECKYYFLNPRDPKQ